MLILKIEKMKKIAIVICSAFMFSGCAELQNVVNNLPTSPHTNTSNTRGLTSFDISNGLKQALEFGVANGVDLLSQKDGYFGNNLVKILLPEPLQKVDNTLRSIGLASLADEGLKLLNRAAENAVTEAKPIFLSAIKNLTFSDAMGLLVGEKNAATEYLKRQTTTQLVSAFAPKIKNSLDQVGANTIWSQIIGKYNSLPLVTPVNADLTAYVTEKAINGLFIQIAQKEADIRQNVSSRTTPLLQRVFAK